MFAFEINGVDYLDTLVYSSLLINESLHLNGSQMSCDLEISKLPGHPTYPKAGQAVLFTFAQAGKPAEREFAGRIFQLTQRANSVSSVRVRLDCVDFTHDLDFVLLQPKTYIEQRAGQTVRDIVGDVGRHFSAEAVEDGPKYEEVEVDLDRPSSTLQGIAQGTGHQFFVDYNRDIHYTPIARSELPSPTAFIDLDVEVDAYQDLEYTEDWSQVKNRLYIIDAQIRAGPEVINTLPDHDITFFPLHFEPWGPDNTSVTVDDVPQTLFLEPTHADGWQGDGPANTCYLCIENRGVRFPDNHPVPSGARVRVRYSIVQTEPVLVQDQNSIDAMKLLEDHPPLAPSDGVHEMKLSLSSLRLSNREALYEYARTILKRYTEVERILSFRSTLQGWRAGQTVEITSTSRGIAEDGLYIRSVQKSIWIPYPGGQFSTPTLQYQIEASSSPYHT